MFIPTDKIITKFPIVLLFANAINVIPMKKIFIIGVVSLVAFLGFSTKILAQCPVSWNFSSQAQIDLFGTDYPNCKHYQSDIIIDDSSDIVNGNYSIDVVDLTPLANIETINGALTIKRCSKLQVLTGLNQIRFATQLYIDENDRLQDFVGLAGLDTITQAISIRLNDSLKNFDGMGELQGNMLGGIKITDNPMLEYVSSLKGIVSIDGDLTLKRNHLLSMSGMDKMETIGGFVNVKLEPFLTDVSQFAALKYVGSDFVISSNDILSNLDGYDNLDSIGGILYIWNNPLLGNCDGVCPVVHDSLVHGILVSDNKTNSDCHYYQVLKEHCDVLLPIELAYFQSNRLDDAGQILLDWGTFSEVNNEGFFIQKSRNGREWMDIGWVDGAGTTNESESYSFRDSAPFSGINYYRLKQVDFDGIASYSNLLAERFGGKSILVTIYPNPTTDFLFVQTLAQKTTMFLYNSTGQLVLDGELHGDAIDVSSLPQGIYYMALFLDGHEYHERLIIGD